MNLCLCFGAGVFNSETCQAAPVEAMCSSFSTLTSHSLLSSGGQWCVLVALMGTSVVASAEHIFMYLLDRLYIFLGEMSISIFCSFPPSIIIFIVELLRPSSQGQFAIFSLITEVVFLFYLWKDIFFEA